eukprot:6477418-Amphidinium_carterae.1
MQACQSKRLNEWSLCSPYTVPACHACDDILLPSPSGRHRSLGTTLDLPLPLPQPVLDVMWLFKGDCVQATDRFTVDS